LASITVSISTVTGSTPVVNNTKATTITAKFIAANNGPVNGTNQEKLDWVAIELAKYMVAVANAHEIGERVETEREAAKAELESRDWV
jgi:cation transport regulator ChaC